MKTTYEEKLVEQLKADRWLRHLFNKIGKQVTVSTRNGERIKGILKTIEFINGIINLEVKANNKVYFINWKYVCFVEYSEGGENGKK